MGTECSRFVQLVARSREEEMIPRSNSFLPYEPVSTSSPLGYVDLESNAGLISNVDDHAMTLQYSLSILKERVHQAQALVSLLSSNNNEHHHTPIEQPSLAMIRVSSLVQEIVSLSSSLMFTFQQMSLDTNLGYKNPNPSLQLQTTSHVNQANKQEQIVGDNNLFGSNDLQMEWFSGQISFRDVDISYDPTTSTNTNSMQQERSDHTRPNPNNPSSDHALIIEMDAADLLAKYTHYCEICNKGFKRDANLRMHMRAHGDEYKSVAALTKPNAATSLSNSQLDNNKVQVGQRYSCPQDGCRWNRKHPKFQPLKSIICVKNHYKRSHCPKMYVCKRCSQKQFSVLSDLRTHEKHCGDLKWRCSCGTTFSRKDKLVGHVGLFSGHFPVTSDSTC